MLAIFLRTIKDRKISLFMYCIAGIGFLWMYVLLFPSIQKQGESFLELMKGYPEGLMKIFGIEEFSFLTIESFLAIEQFSFIWPILVIFLLVSTAGTALAGEIEKGTIEIMLASPTSRRHIFGGRYLAGVFALLIFTVCSVFAVIPLAEIHNVDYLLKSYIAMALMGFLFGLAVFSFAMLLSAISSERSRVYMITGSILIVMYVLNVVSMLKESLSYLQYFSFFHYYDPHSALVGSTVSGVAILVFIIVVIVCTVAGAILFSTRDIKSV